jgi:tripartite-type tricarboxylate transporter receptor subunit TctC
MDNISMTSRAIGRRSLILASAASVAAPAIVRAEAPWPSKPIRIIVPFGPGGSTDISMRILAPKLSEMLGQTCVVENRAGAGGVVGTDIVTKSAPDGYTLGHCTVSQVVIAPALYERLPFAPEKDLTPISPTVFVPMCLSVTRKGLKVNSVQELVAEMRANPGKLSYASNGIGATSHLAGANLLRLTGCQAEHVPYKSGAEAIQALVNGDVQWAFDVPVLHGPHHRDGNLRILMASPDRQPLIPDVPNPTEAGLPEFKAYSWFGIFGPAGLPKSVVDKLSTVMAEALAEAVIAKRLNDNGLPPMIQYTTLAKFEQFIAQERVFWPPIVRASGARVQ